MKKVKHICELKKKRIRKVHLGIKYLKYLRESSLLWRNHFRVGLYFHSSASIDYERKRHLTSKYRYIIHPFSKVMLIRDTINIAIWMMTFFHDPWVAAFTLNHKHAEEKEWCFLFIINIYFLCNCILDFITGYIDITTREVIIEQKLIIKHYLRTYFVFDLLGSFPYAEILYIAKSDEEIISLCQWLHLLRSVRIRYVIRRVREFYEYCDFNATYFYIVTTTFLLMFNINLFVSAFICIPRYMNYKQSWMINYLATKTKKYEELSIVEVYFDILHITLMYYFHCGNEENFLVNTLEYSISTLIYISGFIARLLISAFFMIMMNASYISETRFQQLVYQTISFSKQNHLTTSIANQLEAYYSAIFQGKYFEVDQIYSSLSESLRSDLLLHECREIVYRLKIFKGLPKDTIQCALEKSKKEYYLTNDILYTPDHLVDSLYFISHGTVAIFYRNGFEWSHYIDGDIAGEMPYLNNGVSETIAIAAETCEILIIDTVDFDDICLKCPELKQRILDSAASKRRRVKVKFGEEKQSQEEYIAELTRCLERRLRRDNNEYL